LVEPFFCIEKYFFIQGGRLVCKTWNLFLIKDEKLWMDILSKQTQPFFEFLSKKLSKVDFADARKTWKEYFDFVEKNDYFCQKIIKNYKRIQNIQVHLQDLSHGCQRFEVKFRFALRKKLDRQVKKKIKPQKPKNYEKLKELKANYEANQHPIFLRVKLTLT
jgi:hypothetical protein